MKKKGRTDLWWLEANYYTGSAHRATMIQYGPGPVSTREVSGNKYWEGEGGKHLKSSLLGKIDNFSSRNMNIHL